MSYEYDGIGLKQGIVLAALKSWSRAAAEAHGAEAGRVWRRAGWRLGLAAVFSTAATVALLFEAVAFMSSGLAVLLGRRTNPRYRAAGTWSTQLGLGSSRSPSWGPTRRH